MSYVTSTGRVYAARPGLAPGTMPKSRVRRLPDNPNWPGPFTARESGYVSTAVWLSCAYCGALFRRSTREVKSRRTSSRTNHSVCSINCGRQLTISRSPKKHRLCTFCGKRFEHIAIRPRKTCSPQCAHRLMSEYRTQLANTGLQIYALEHGIEPDHRALTCDLCGAAQRVHGRVESRYFVRITDRLGGWSAWCRVCYRSIKDVEDAKLALMSPGERLRYHQAQELIKEFTRA